MTEREELARIVDPSAFALLQGPDRTKRVEEALAAADRVIAARPKPDRESLIRAMTDAALRAYVPKGNVPDPCVMDPNSYGDRDALPHLQMSGTNFLNATQMRVVIEQVFDNAILAAGYRKGSEGEDAVADALAMLRKHFGEPVMPVSQYCDAFRTWANALTEASVDPKWRERNPGLAPIADMAQSIGIAIVKSCLLDRLIYGGEAIRTEKCEHHRGFWSGCHYPEQPDYTAPDGTVHKFWCDDCNYGSNITGWKRHPEGSSDASRGPAIVAALSGSVPSEEQR